MICDVKLNIFDDFITRGVWLIDLHPYQHDNGYMVGHRLRPTATNGHRFTAPSLSWRLPIQVLIGLDVT